MHRFCHDRPSVWGSKWLIKTYTNEGEMVLDSCMGVGSTGIACKNTNRDFIGIELDDKFFEIAKKSLEIS